MKTQRDELVAGYISVDVSPNFQGDVPLGMAPNEQGQGIGRSYPKINSIKCELVDSKENY